MRRHGTNSAYAGGCHCEPCRRAHAKQHQLWRMGRRTRTDATPTVALVRWMKQQGATNRWIANQAGVSPETVRRILRDPDANVFDRTARKIQRVARDMASGTIHPPFYAEARDRELQRERRRMYRAQEAA